MRRDLLKAFGLGAAFAPTLFSAITQRLNDGVVNAKDARLTREPFGDLRVFFEGATQQLKSVTAGSLRLNPGMQPHPPHQHPEEEFIVVTEGGGEMLVGGKTVAVQAGSMMYCAGNALHGIKNTGGTPLLFYYYKWLA